jgi:hypothetical protein
MVLLTFVGFFPSVYPHKNGTSPDGTGVGIGVLNDMNIVGVGLSTGGVYHVGVGIEVTNGDGVGVAGTSPCI